VTQAAPEKWTPDWSRVRRVLLIRLRSIGDTVLMTPCLEALKAWRPAVSITVLSEPLSAPILEDHPLVDRLIVSNESLYSRAGLVSRLRRERFDLAFNMHGGTTATIMAGLSGARHAIGYGDYRHAWMLTARAPAPDRILGRGRIHSVEQQLALLHWSGVPWPQARPRLSLAVSKGSEASAREKLKAGGSFALIMPGAAFESKRWAASGFAAVADHLSERWNLPCVVVAGPGQQRLAREVAEATRSNARLLGGLSLKELVAVISLARVFVGNDSGPMHIAAALRRPLAAIFGSSDSSVWHPWTDSPYRVVEGRGDQAVTNVADSPGGESGLSIRRVPASAVIAAVDEVLESALAAG
jgi:heptosyltransferase-3